MRAHRLLPVLLAVLGGTAGCESSGGVPTSRELSLAQFDDVPVPRGFVLDTREGRSFTYSEGGSGPAPIRLGRLEYAGQGSPEDTLAWYAAEMPRPIHGWSAGEPAPGREGALLFRRGAEACLVTVRAEGSGLRVVVERNTGRAVGRE